ncbi:hypothetical protein AX774_g7957 [Zancudomyces culisetae]|uniref:Uncharacterized protein n=1 Tax=Zancudomyces culisetae TaxID=1213189 RepID=A0A1R1PCI4_ZANCU|nr:hypothetical protein AX774_g7957 [Zancudomyces culisetae]|eukprot:OMH78651.1 hypothetical protein AX774_g7957 [Zancudomyces culisetae]
MTDFEHKVFHYLVFLPCFFVVYPLHAHDYHPHPRFLFHHSFHLHPHPHPDLPFLHFDPSPHHFLSSPYQHSHPLYPHPPFPPSYVSLTIPCPPQIPLPLLYHLSSLQCLHLFPLHRQTSNVSLPVSSSHLPFFYFLPAQLCFHHFPNFCFLLFHPSPPKTPETLDPSHISPLFPRIEFSLHFLPSTVCPQSHSRFLHSLPPFLSPLSLAALAPFFSPFPPLLVSFFL